MKTETQKIRDWFKTQDFSMSPVLLSKGLVVHHRITPSGSHNLIHAVHYCDYGGANVKPGKIGCIVFCYYGMERKKHKQYKANSEILKYVSCTLKTADKVVAAYKQWYASTQETIASWAVVI